MSVLHNVAHFARWRVIALRYAGKLRGLSTRAAPLGARAADGSGSAHQRSRHMPPRRRSRAGARGMVRIYCPRMTPSPAKRCRTSVRESVSPGDDIDADNPVVQPAFSPEILDVADDYFAGRLILDSIQVLYSWPTRGALRESQLWHKDYGDWKSFHWIAYLNDVNGPDDGPFSFIDKRDARRIAPSPFIRRIAGR